MATTKKYCGVVVPMVTPFTDDGKIDESAAKKIANHIIEGGAAPFILGTTGEAASIPLLVRSQFAKWIVEEAQNRTRVYAGISSNCVEESLTLAKQFYDLGVDALVAHLPSYYPLTADHMLIHFETLAEKSPGPIMIYNIKSTTHMSIPLQVIEELSHHTNIIGVKDSERDYKRMERFAELFSDRSDFSLMIGWSAQSTKALSRGFDGIVPSVGNLVPKMFRDLYDAVISGNKETADRLQAETDEIARVHQEGKILSQAIAGLKVMMSELGLCGPSVLPPLTRLLSAEEAQIRKDMNKMPWFKKSH